MNEIAPGCVNAAGFLDPDHPALDTVHTAVCITNTLDLTGIQYLHHLKNLTIFCPGEGVNTPVLPDSLQMLTLGGFGFTEPITIPEGLRSLYAYWSGEIIGPIPSSLDTLLNHAMNGSVDVLLMPLPEGLSYLEIITSARIVGLTSFPSSLRHLHLITNTPLCLPVLPSQMDYLELGSSTAFCLPNLPSIQDPENLILPDFIQFCDPFDECLYSNALGGSVWHDPDADGLRGPEEKPMSGDAVLINSTSIAGVNPDGYWMRAATEGNYSVSVLPRSPHAIVQSPGVQTAVLNAAEPVVILPGSSYQLIPGITDLDLDLTASQLIAGRTTYIRMTVLNLGSETAAGTATLNIPPGLTITEIIPDPLVLDDQSITWALADLQMGEQSTWTISATVAVLPPATTLTFTGHVATNASDIDPSNNSSIWTDQVLAAFDPNDKLVTPAIALASAITSGVELSYTVRFQNTGNYPASRVVIVDSLSSDLVISTMRYVSSSHPCSWSLADGVLTFRFDPIFLPDSASDEAGSQGFVKFRITTQPALAVGHQIHNSASIFFDLNPPIQTASSVFEVVDGTTSAATITPGDVIIGPNPVSDVLYVVLNQSWGSPVRLSVTDMLGKRIMLAGSQGRMEIDLSGLASGPLHVSVTDAERHHFAKVIKH